MSRGFSKQARGPTSACAACNFFFCFHSTKGVAATFFIAWSECFFVVATNFKWVKRAFVYFATVEYANFVAAEYDKLIQKDTSPSEYEINGSSRGRWTCGGRKRTSMKDGRTVRGVENVRLQGRLVWLLMEIIVVSTHQGVCADFINAIGNWKVAIDGGDFFSSTAFRLLWFFKLSDSLIFFLQKIRDTIFHFSVSLEPEAREGDKSLIITIPETTSF